MAEPDHADRDDADAKAWFYLDHREDIEAWKALRPLGRELLDNFMVREVAEIDEWADELSAVVESESLESGSIPRVGLRRAAWQSAGLAGLSVVVEWERARLLTPGSNEWPYVAVRWPADLSGDDRRRQLSEALKPVRAQLAGQSSRNFPYWRYVKPLSGRPLDPEALAREAVQNLRTLWDVATPVLDGLRLEPRD